MHNNRIIMKKRDWFAKPIYSVVPCCYLLSCISVSAYKFMALNYSFRVAYHTVFTFIMQIFVNILQSSFLPGFVPHKNEDRRMSAFTKLNFKISQKHRRLAFIFSLLVRLIWFCETAKLNKSVLSNLKRMT